MTDEQKAIDKHFADERLSNTGVKAALIDMDGVLYDSMKGHTAAWFRMATELAYRHLGYTPPRDDASLF